MEKSKPELHYFDNGLQLIFQENNASPVITSQAWINAGSADETEAESGIAHVLEHMLFKGTLKYPGEQIANIIEGSGGNINAFTSFDQTVYHLSIASNYLKLAIETIGDMVQNPLMQKDSIESEKEVIIEEINRSLDSPGRIISHSLFETAFKGHPYSKPIIGTKQSVSSFSKASISKFFKKWYNPKNIIFIVIGDTTRQKVIKQLEKTFNCNYVREKSAQVFKPIKRERSELKTQTQPRFALKFKNINEAMIDIAFPVPNINNKDTAGIDMMCAVLGQGDTSFLYHNIKFKSQLVNDISTYSYTPKDKGIVLVSVSLNPQKLEPALKEVVKRLVEFKHMSHSNDDLEKARINILSGHIFQKETVEGQARKLGLYYTMSGKLDYEKIYHDSIEDCTKEDISDLSREYLKKNKMTAAFLLPEDLKGKYSTSKLKQIMLKTFEEEEKKYKIKTKKQISPVYRGREKNLMSNVYIHTLDSGIKLILKPNPVVPLIATRAAMLGGVRYETAANNGAFALYSRMLTMGTKTRSATDISNSIESKAASLGGYSGKNSFGVEGEFLKKYLHEGLELFADTIINPSFPELEFKNERKNILEHIRVQEDSPSNFVFKLFSQKLFNNHPYKYNIIGTEESVSSLTRDSLVKLHRKYIKPDNLIVSAVGDFNVHNMIDKFEEIFSDISRTKSTLPKIPTEDFSSEPRQYHHELNKQQTHILYGFPGTTIANKDRYTSDLIQAILSGQGGRLFVELRDKLSLAYSVFAISMEGLEPGYIAAYIACSPEKKNLAIDRLMRELDRLKRHKVGLRELERAKKYLTGRQAIELQKNAAQAFFLAYDELYDLGTGNTMDYSKFINAITPEDIINFANRYFNHNKSLLITVGK